MKAVVCQTDLVSIQMSKTTSNGSKKPWLLCNYQLLIKEKSQMSMHCITASFISLHKTYMYNWALLIIHFNHDCTKWLAVENFYIYTKENKHLKVHRTINILNSWGFRSHLQNFWRLEQNYFRILKNPTRNPTSMQLNSAIECKYRVKTEQI